MLSVSFLIMERFTTIVARHFKLSFKELVGMAYRERRSLGERGYYATRGIDFDWNVGQARPSLYFTMGAAVAEVLIDRFTRTA